MNVAFEFENDGSDHDDLVLKVGESVWRCDSYYLALDRRLLPDQEDARKVRTVLRALLEPEEVLIAVLQTPVSPSE